MSVNCHFYGTYIRSAPVELMGEHAMLRATEDGGFEAQFNNLARFNRHADDWAFGWHKFDASDFKLWEDEDVTTNLGK